MKHFCHLLFYFLVCSTLLNAESQTPVPAEISVENAKGDITISLPDGILHIFLFQRGTRSEGIHGRLEFDGKSIEGGKIGEERRSGPITLKWFGPLKSRKYPWAYSGWIPVAFGYHSLQQNAEQGAAANP